MIKGVGLNPISQSSHAPNSTSGNSLTSGDGWQQQVMVPITEVGLVGAHDFHVASQSIYFSDRLKYEIWHYYFISFSDDQHIYLQIDY